MWTCLCNFQTIMMLLNQEFNSEFSVFVDVPNTLGEDYGICDNFWQNLRSRGMPYTLSGQPYWDLMLSRLLAQKARSIVKRSHHMTFIQMPFVDVNTQPWPSSTKTYTSTPLHILACCLDHELKFKHNNIPFIAIEHKIVRALFQKISFLLWS